MQSPKPPRTQLFSSEPKNNKTKTKKKTQTKFRHTQTPGCSLPQRQQRQKTTKAPWPRPPSPPSPESTHHSLYSAKGIVTPVWRVLDDLHNPRFRLFQAHRRRIIGFVVPRVCSIYILNYICWVVSSSFTSWSSPLPLSITLACHVVVLGHSMSVYPGIWFHSERWLWDSWNNWYPVGVNTHPTAGVCVYIYTCQRWLGGALPRWPMKEPEGNFWGHMHPRLAVPRKSKTHLRTVDWRWLSGNKKHCFWPSTPGHQINNYTRFGPSIQCPKNQVNRVKEPNLDFRFLFRFFHKNRQLLGKKKF